MHTILVKWITQHNNIIMCIIQHSRLLLNVFFCVRIDILQHVDHQYCNKHTLSTCLHKEIFYVDHQYRRMHTLYTHVFTKREIFYVDHQYCNKHTLWTCLHCIMFHRYLLCLTTSIVESPHCEHVSKKRSSMLTTSIVINTLSTWFHKEIFCIDNKNCSTHTLSPKRDLLCWQQVLYNLYL